MNKKTILLLSGTGAIVGILLSSFFPYNLIISTPCGLIAGWVLCDILMGEL